jgi:hypothetical protein
MLLLGLAILLNCAGLPYHQPGATSGEAITVFISLQALQHIIGAQDCSATPEPLWDGATPQQKSLHLPHQ